MRASRWNPRQYDRFREQRQQPFYDLLALLRHRPNMRVVDLGCGTGELTSILHRELQARATTGIDLSPSMLARTGDWSAPGLDFEQMDIATWSSGEPLDLVFSHAALQWVEDHGRLFSHLSAMLAPGGQLAIQMPANHDHPSHLVAARVAGEEPFLSALDGYVRRIPLLSPEAYAMLLNDLGFVEQHVRLQIYPHMLADRAEVVEWVRGTLLVDYQERMPESLFEEFLSTYRARLLPELSAAQPYFYSFKRLLLWAAKA